MPFALCRICQETMVLPLGTVAGECDRCAARAPKVRLMTDDQLQRKMDRSREAGVAEERARWERLTGRATFA